MISQLYDLKCVRTISTKVQDGEDIIMCQLLHHHGAQAPIIVYTCDDQGSPEHEEIPITAVFGKRVTFLGGRNHRTISAQAIKWSPAYEIPSLTNYKAAERGNRKH